MLMSSVLQKKCFLKTTAERIKCKIFSCQPGGITKRIAS